MNQVGFDSEKYIRLQSEHIRERINQFGGKLYLEFGGKLFDDYHASRAAAIWASPTIPTWRGSSTFSAASVSMSARSR